MKISKLMTGTLLLTSLVFSAQAVTLNVETFNPKNDSTFPVSSNLISGDNEAILIDAQFHKKDAEQLVKMIQDSHKQLTTIYISHSDPDYYFGLDTITKAFPNAKIIATQETVDAIKATKDGKLAYWGEVLKEDAPETLIVPTALSGTTFTLEGEEIQIQGLDGKAPERSFLWIPSIQTVMGGVVVSDNIHVWIADTQTPESLDAWEETLTLIQSLQPKVVIPGHFVGDSTLNLDSVKFTEQYLKDFRAANASSKNSEELIAKMTALYPNLEDASSLEMSAQVIQGEMAWPQ
ncbi:MBL fold metallo-hydrolase [Wohlfahrtiimonas larvae]|uniref:MBL fold metallo-hydrolase n=1 Tax=Wohlfahrtiimonas larvae TaxID=1157986 RepID=A0ABP9MQV1_9GAMM|nr:MBL fold metallo-hydrolase [Wohlfahrtiimonas larvae]